MTKFPAVNPDDCIKALMKAGFRIARQRGSHVILVRDSPPPARTVVVPTSKKPLPRGTLNSIIKQAGLTGDEFLALLDSI